MDPIIKTEKISKRFNNKEIILKEVDISILPNSFIAILGPSGSGKSTFLNVLSGQLKPTSGKVLYKGRDITKMSNSEISTLKRNEIGFIFQQYLLLSNLTVEENIRIGMPNGKQSLSFNEIIQVLGIEKLLNKFPSQLSGGQQQRVAIARAIIKRPEILFCDEATGSLDEENSIKVIELLHEIKKRFEVTILFTTHNLAIAKTADRVITFKDGKVIKDVWNENPLSPNEMVWE